MAEQQQDPKNRQTEPERLAEESNRNRMDFLRTELQTCLTFVGVAETEQSVGNPEHAAKSIADAEHGYETMLRFMSDPKHAKHLTEEERLELTAGMEQLRAQIDKLAPPV